ncbi:5-methylthioadenosine/S-adenosylhomocysteine deaminase [Leucobacter komagatae]|uniref:5-methylthioadenosine/S-adenosylhomocysteine deaminase n=1 Tax=Leucobacter komagatae TaxID=55969 RepID=A0A542Y954_9MICO|nr:amidohydrolase [Leucobacter komagatae]TQL44618.1 5-methylthioadenosine/S-adenosylhomocysteine deaminase [Leucobacter komagatae]
MTIETVLRADSMLTPAGTVAPAELAFDETGRITYAGAPRPESVVTHDLAGHALMPGLTNGHTHSAMTLQRGVSDDESFMQWLATVQGIEQRLTHDDLVAGLELALLEMIETGTVAFADMYYWDEALIERVRSAGMRVFAALACSATDHVAYPTVSPMTGAEVLDEVERLAAHYREDPLVRVGFGPHAPYTCTPEFLREVRSRALAGGIPIHTHVSESAAEVAQIREQYGKTPGEHLASLDFFDADVHAAHCVHLTAGEISTFAETGTSISHNPVSNLKLGNGIAPFPEMIGAGLELAIGTDSVASNNSLDLFEELKHATILHRGARQDAAAVLGPQVLDIATRGGAAAIGFPESGALAAGKFADVVAVDLRGTAAAPLAPESLVAHLVYGATGRDVRHVFIGGRHVYADGEHLTLDADAVKARAREARARLVA